MESTIPTTTYRFKDSSGNFALRNISYYYNYNATLLSEYDEDKNCIATYDTTDLSTYEKLGIPYKNNKYLIVNILLKQKLHLYRPIDLILCNHLVVFDYFESFISLTINDLNWLAHFSDLKGNAVLKIEKHHIKWLQNEIRFDVLDWWVDYYFDNKMDFPYDNTCIDNITYLPDSYLKILDWWLQFHLKTGLPILYTHQAIDRLCYNDDITIIPILNWWLKLYQDYGFPMLYTEVLTNQASVEELNWLFSVSEIYPEIKFVYSDKSFYYVDLDRYNWWLQFHYDTQRELLYTVDDLLYAVLTGRIDVMDWWIASGLKLKYPKNMVNSIHKVDMLDWMYQHHKMGLIDFEYTSLAIDSIQKQSVLEWWFQKYIEDGLPLLYTHYAIDKLLNPFEDDMEMLNMWLDMHVNYGLPLLYTKFDYYRYSYMRTLEKLDWWFNAFIMHQLAFPGYDQLISSANYYGETPIKEWFEAHPEISHG